MGGAPIAIKLRSSPLLHDKSGFDLVVASSPMAWMRAFCVAWEGSCSGVFSHPLGHKYETSREEIRLSAQRGASTYHQASDLTPYPGFCRFLIFESKQEFCVRWRLAVMLKLPQFTRTPAPRSMVLPTLRVSNVLDETLQLAVLIRCQEP